MALSRLKVYIDNHIVFILLVFIFRLTDGTNKDAILEEGRMLLLRSTQADLQNHIEEIAAEIRKKNYDRYKFLGNSLRNSITN